MNLATLSRRVVASTVLIGAGVFAVPALGSFDGTATAHAQSGPSCSSATQGAAAENQQAFVDVGAGNTAAFVCISSSAFTGGKSAPITANGVAGDGCYIVQGLGTSVVAVFRESPAVKQCPDLVRIDVGLAQAATPTPTATQPPATATATQPAATATPTRTPTAPPATATATPRPPSPTAPPATVTQAPPTPPAPRPPATGNGLAEGDEQPLAALAIAAAVLGVTIAGGWGFSRRHHRSR